MFRTEAPDTRHTFDYHVENANALLNERWGAPEVSGTALLGAIIGAFRRSLETA